MVRKLAEYLLKLENRIDYSENKARNGTPDDLIDYTIKVSPLLENLYLYSAI